MERIESSTNKKIKLAASLHLRKHREQQGLFLAEGIRLAEMALSSSWPIAFALCTPKAAALPRVRELLEKMALRGESVYEVSEDIYRKAAGTVEPQGFLLVMQQRKQELSCFTGKKKNPLWVVLDGVQDPGNAGTLIRTADAAGADGVILLSNTVDVFSEKTVRASMGSLFHLPVFPRVEIAALREFLSAEAVPLMVTALQPEAKNCFAVDYRKGAAIVFGNEGNGVSEELLAAAKGMVYIPMRGAAESLNVSISAAVILYEAMRQRFFQS